MYFQAKGEPVVFLDDLGFKEWQARGYDAHSIVADPGFADAAKGDFGLKPGSPAPALGFQPIDVSKAGLEGPPEWVDLAKRVVRPAETVPSRFVAAPQLVDDGFEDGLVGTTAELATTYGETAQATIRVTDEAAASGKHSLKFTDASGLDHTWNPHIWYSPHLAEGLIRQTFDLRLEKGAEVWMEWRDDAAPYHVGPSIGIDAQGRLTANTVQIMALPVEQWVHFEIVCGLGKQACGRYDLTVAVPGQPPRRFERLACDSKLRRLDWLGFVSNATKSAVFYLDNVKVECAKP